MADIIELSPEPGPDFTTGRQKWGVAWPLFFNSFGVLFSLLFLYTLKNICALATMPKTFQRRKFFLVVNIVLAYFTCVTSLCLLIDPYNSGEYFEVIKFRGIIFLFDGLRLPCITASFSLITMSLLEATKLQLYSPRLQSWKCIFSVIFIHFSLTLGFDLTFLFVRHLLLFLMLCQVSMVTVGLAVSIVSFHTGYKVMSYTAHTRAVINSTMSSYGGTREGERDTELKSISTQTTSVMPSSTKKRSKVAGTYRKSIAQIQSCYKDKRIGRIATITLITALFGILYCVTTIYSLVSVYQTSNRSPDVWAWYALNTFVKICELGMIVPMMYIVRRGKITKMLKKCWQRY